MLTYTAILAIAISTAIFLMLLSYVVLRLTLTRNIRKIAAKNHEYYFDDDGYLGFMNTAFLTWACAAPAVKHWKNYDRYKPTNIDVRANASALEIVFSYILTISASTLVIYSLIHAITDYFGWVDWGVYTVTGLELTSEKLIPSCD